MYSNPALLGFLSLVSIGSLTIVTITRIVAMAENIRSLRSSQLLKTDFHTIAGIVQIAGHVRSSRSLRSLCYDFYMIAGIVKIAVIAALVVSINLLRSLTIATIAEIDADSISAIVIVKLYDRWQLLGSLAIAGKMKIWFPYDRYDR